MINLIFLIDIFNQTLVNSSTTNAISLINFDFFFNQALAVLIAAVISALVSIWLFHRQNQKNFRIAYITTIFHNEIILNKFSQLLSNLHKMKNINKMVDEDTLTSIKYSINFGIRESWLILLFAPSPELYSKLTKSINDENWSDAIDIILRFISGNW